VRDLLPTSAALAHYLSRAQGLNGDGLMQASDKNNNTEREPADLDDRYGEIGISAVAAALRYCSDAKNPAYAPVVVHAMDEREDAAA
jgi:hypothetical protein